MKLKNVILIDSNFHALAERAEAIIDLYLKSDYTLVSTISGSRGDSFYVALIFGTKNEVH